MRQLKHKKTGLQPKILLLCIGLGTLIANSITIIITLIHAYLNNYQATITTNTYGEGNIELVLLPVLLIIGVWSVFYLLKQSFRRDGVGSLSE